jgi:hypothetical protein
VCRCAVFKPDRVVGSTTRNVASNEFLTSVNGKDIFVYFARSVRDLARCITSFPTTRVSDKPQTRKIYLDQLVSPFD